MPFPVRAVMPTGYAPHEPGVPVPPRHRPRRPTGCAPHGRGCFEEAGTLVHHPGLRLDSRFPEVDWVYGAYGACRAIGYAME